MLHTSLLSVVGPTATGKTDLAFAIAREVLDQGRFPTVEVISADSRQLYQGLETLSGADIPQDFSFQTDSALPYAYWQNVDATIRLHGVSCIKPNQDWSVAHFQQLAQSVIAAFPRSVVIIVGGTGLYHAHLFTSDPQLSVPPNLELREKLATLNVLELQQALQAVDPLRWAGMNNSDQHNPRRLMRAIELGSSTELLEEAAVKYGDTRVKHDTFLVKTESSNPGHHNIIGLSASLPYLEERIHQRVLSRWQAGALEEVQALVSTYGAQVQASTATGFREILANQQGEVTAEECLRLWSLHEFQYAKRQITWWKKKKVVWIDREGAGWLDTGVQTAISLLSQTN